MKNKNLKDRLGFARLEWLLENLKREIDMTSLTTLIVGTLKATYGKFSYVMNPTDSEDTKFHDSKSNECGRIVAGESPSDSSLSIQGHGLGLKRPVLYVAAEDGGTSVALTAAESGAIIQCNANAGSISFSLPRLADNSDSGMFFIFTLIVPNPEGDDGSYTVSITTDGGDGNDADNFNLYQPKSETWSELPDLIGDLITIPAGAARGTTVEVIALYSGVNNAAEQWLVRAYSLQKITNT